MFEKRLKQLNPNMRQITYDINDLYTYIDSLPDLSALVYSAGARAAGEPYSACICGPRWQPLVSAACAQLTLASLLGGRSGWAPGVPRTCVLTLCTTHRHQGVCAARQGVAEDDGVCTLEATGGLIAQALSRGGGCLNAPRCSLWRCGQLSCCATLRCRRGALYRWMINTEVPHCTRCMLLLSTTAAVRPRSFYRHEMCAPPPR